MKTIEEKREYGLKVFGEIMGPEKAAGLREVGDTTGFGSDIARLAVNYAFADVWGSDMLERKQRSFVTLAILIATRQTLELKNHVRIAVANGLTARELEGVLTQCVPYLGFPAVASATSAVIETLRELGIDTVTKTSEERGLL
jgi:4-carboxymuconolactone decarboxylase